jgi:hypothetical protein
MALTTVPPGALRLAVFETWDAAGSSPAISRPTFFITSKL